MRIRKPVELLCILFMATNEDLEKPDRLFDSQKIIHRPHLRGKIFGRFP